MWNGRCVRIASTLLGATLPAQDGKAPVPSPADLTAWVAAVEGDDLPARLQAWHELLRDPAAAAPFVVAALSGTGNQVNPFQQVAQRQPLASIPPRPDPVAKMGGRVEDWLAARFAVGVPAPATARLLGAWAQIEPDDEFVRRSADANERLLILCGLLGGNAAGAVPRLIEILDATAGRQGAAAWALEHIGAPALAPLLESLRTPVRSELALALMIHVVGRIGRAAPVDAARAVVSLLADASSLSRATAFHAVVQLGRGAVPELMAALRHERAARRYFALMALCRIARGTELANLLAEACADPDVVIRDYATTAAGHLFATGALRDEHAGFLAERLARAWSAGRQAPAPSLLLTLAAFGPHAAPALPLVKGAAAGGNRELELIALLLHARIGGPAAAAALSELLARLDQGPPERALAIVGVLASTPRESLPSDTAAAMERTWARFPAHTADAAALRLAALRRLADLAVDTPALRAIVAEARASLDFDLCVAAGLARARLDGAAVAEELIADLTATHSFDRRVAAAVLGMLAVPEAEPALAAAALREGHEATRATMTTALTGLAARRAAPR